MTPDDLIEGKERPMKRGILVYGPQGCGKTTHAAAVAKLLGKKRIIDPWSPGDPLPPNAVAFTNADTRAADYRAEDLIERLASTASLAR